MKASRLGQLRSTPQASSPACFSRSSSTCTSRATTALGPHDPALHALARHPRYAPRARRAGPARRPLVVERSARQLGQFLLSATRPRPSGSTVRYVDPDRHPADFSGAPAEIRHRGGADRGRRGRDRRRHRHVARTRQAILPLGRRARRRSRRDAGSLESRASASRSRSAR